MITKTNNFCCFCRQPSREYDQLDCSHFICFKCQQIYEQSTQDRRQKNNTSRSGTQENQFAFSITCIICQIQTQFYTDQGFQRQTDANYDQIVPPPYETYYFAKQNSLQQNPKTTNLGSCQSVNYSNQTNQNLFPSSSKQNNHKTQKTFQQSSENEDQIEETENHNHDLFQLPQRNEQNKLRHSASQNNINNNQNTGHFANNASSNSQLPFFQNNQQQNKNINEQSQTLANQNLNFSLTSSVNLRQSGPNFPQNGHNNQYSENRNHNILSEQISNFNRSSVTPQILHEKIIEMGESPDSNIAESQQKLQQLIESFKKEDPKQNCSPMIKQSGSRKDINNSNENTSRQTTISSLRKPTFNSSAADQLVETIQDLKKKLPHAIKCTQHNEDFSLICLFDRQLCCVECAYKQSGHKKHNVIPLKTAIQMVKEDNQNFIDELKEQMFMIEDSFRVLKENRALLESTLMSTADIIKNEFNYIISALQRKQEEIMDTFTNFFQTQISDIQKQTTSMSFLQSCLRDFKDIENNQNFANPDTQVYLYSVQNMLKQAFQNFQIKTNLIGREDLNIFDFTNRSNILRDIEFFGQSQLKSPIKGKLNTLCTPRKDRLATVTKESPNTKQNTQNSNYFENAPKTFRNRTPPQTEIFITTDRLNKQKQSNSQSPSSIQETNISLNKPPIDFDQAFVKHLQKFQTDTPTQTINQEQSLNSKSKSGSKPHNNRRQNQNSFGPFFEEQSKISNIQMDSSSTFSNHFLSCANNTIINPAESSENVSYLLSTTNSNHSRGFGEPLNQSNQSRFNFDNNFLTAAQDHIQTNNTTGTYTSNSKLLPNGNKSYNKENIFPVEKCSPNKLINNNIDNILTSSFYEKKNQAGVALGGGAGTNTSISPQQTYNQSPIKENNFTLNWDQNTMGNLFFDSLIFQPEIMNIKDFSSILPPQITKTQLIYRMTDNQISSEQFHQFCDGKSPNFVLISANNCIFGYHSSVPFSQIERYSTCEDAWIFTVLNQENLGPMKFPVKPDQKFIALYQSDQSPCLGSTLQNQQDLWINFDNLQQSCSNLGYAYQNETGKDGSRILAGSYNNWNIQQIQVYSYSQN